VCVDIRAVAPFPKPVTLEAIKADERLKEMVLVRNSRLSVQPVRDEEWRIVCEDGGYKG
jgi:predicted RNA-binding protein with PUA-like domain